MEKLKKIASWLKGSNRKVETAMIA